MSKRVLHISTTLERGGAENQLLILVREQIAEGLEVTVAGIKGNSELNADFEKLGARVLTRLNNKSILSIVIFLSRYFANNEDVVVHAHLPRAEVFTRFALMGKRNRFIVSRHNTEAFFPNVPNFLSRTLSVWVTRRAAGIIAISKAVESFLKEQKEISNLDKLHVIKYAYDPTVIRRPYSPQKKKYDEILRLITIGRLTNQKNYPFMFHALKHLQNQGMNFNLTVLGAGELKSELIALANSLKINENLIWLGKRRDIPNTLSQHEALIMTSRYEGFGLVLLEAMQQSLPIIAPRNSAFPEVLGEDYQGLYRDNDLEAITELLQRLFDVHFRKSLSKASQTRISDFSPYNMVKSVNFLYNF